MKNFVMLSGIPRSGSQVLSSILNQHPLIHSTTTSPVADLLLTVHDQWNILNQALINRNLDQNRNIMKGLLVGAYEHIDKPIIVDKNRLWPRYGKLISQIIQNKPKIICTVRNIPEILASYILLIEKNNTKLTFIDNDLIDLNLPINVKNRCRIIYEKYLNHPYTSLQIGYNEKVADLLFCDYTEIVYESQKTVDKICSWLKIDTVKIDINNLQPMDENDNYHGGLDGLHHVRPILQKTSPTPEKIIGKDLTNYYSNMKLEFWKK